MKKLFVIAGLMVSMVLSKETRAQKIYNDGTVTYNIMVSTGTNEAKAADLLDGATQKIIFKGSQTRSELKVFLVPPSLYMTQRVVLLSL